MEEAGVTPTAPRSAPQLVTSFAIPKGLFVQPNRHERLAGGALGLSQAGWGCLQGSQPCYQQCEGTSLGATYDTST